MFWKIKKNIENKKYYIKILDRFNIVKNREEKKKDKWKGNESK